LITVNVSQIVNHFCTVFART